MEPWRLSDEEWDCLGSLLADEGDAERKAGRKRLTNDRQAAQACLYRHHHRHSAAYRTFGWNDLPTWLGVSPSTANRRYREWTASGAWQRFWAGLLVFRAPHVEKATHWEVIRAPGRFPAGDVMTELERAYVFFNRRFFGGLLPAVALIIENSGKKSCLGYFCARLWHDGNRELGQISIHTSVLGQGPELVLAVLLHEMVHLRNAAQRLDDCHPVNQYHGRQFRDVAVLSGLRCGERHKRLGYALTELSPEGQAACVELALPDELFRWRVG